MTPADVRRWYTWGRTEEFYDDGGTCAPLSEWWAEFDAWLNGVRDAAWDQGRLAAKWDTPNPYRTAAQVRDDMEGDA